MPPGRRSCPHRRPRLPHPRTAEPPIAGPAGGYHAAGYDLAALGEPDAVVAVLSPPQADRLPGYRGAGAELVGLDQGATGELEARETHGEAQVVLYPRTGASLPSQGYRLEGEGGEALRSSVDRRAEARRPCPDYDQVIGLFAGWVYRQANSLGEFGVRRVLEHIFALPDGHRRL